MHPQSDTVLAGVTNYHCKELVSAASLQIKPGLLSSALTEEEEDEKEEEDAEDNNSLLFFDRRNPARVFCHWLKGNTFFVGIVYVTVVCSCLLVMTTPEAPDVPGQTTFIALDIRSTADLIFTCIFTVEMIISVIAQV